MYADFESILEPISWWCVYSKFTYGKSRILLRNIEERCVSKFCEHIIAEVQCLYESFPEKPMEPLTKSQLKAYNRATKCHICFKPFKEDNRKLRDHCRYSGIYRKAAHSRCNLQYKIPSYIPVVFHNLTGCDAHMFIKELAKQGSKMGVIAKNTKDYISFSVNVEVDKYINKNREEKPKEITLRFIDSIKFMSSSLDYLVNNLARGDGEFFGFENYSDHQCGLPI